MAIHLTNLVPITKLAKVWLRPSSSLFSHISLRHIQEFPGLRFDNSKHKDYVLILPETFDKQSSSNEILRLPKSNEPNTDFSRLNTESVYKGLSQTVSDFENFITDMSNGILDQGQSLRDLFKEIEKHLYPMDTAYNILMVLANVQWQAYDHKEIYELMNKYLEARDKRLWGNFRETIDNFVAKDRTSLSNMDKKMLQIYHPASLRAGKISSQDDYQLSQYKRHLKAEMSLFQSNLAGANHLFTHTVDDPDILAVVSSDFNDCKDLHHKERTPLKVTYTSYHKFMQVCPDQFVRQNLWQTFNKRCSPKALPKFNNTASLSNIRILRRKIANFFGFRTHVEYRISSAMAKSRQQILDNLKFLNEENSVSLNDRLQELNDYAADNSFEGTSQLGIQAFDVEYWIHKYMYDILIGKSEADIRGYFPLPVVMSGIKRFFEDYFNLILEEQTQETKDKFWAPEVQLLRITKRDQIVGSVIFDPYQREGKRITDQFYARVRGRANGVDCLPLRFISGSYKQDPVRKQAYLSLTDVINLFYTYGVVIQRLLYNYDYYELNTHGCLEVDTNDLLPNLCVANLLTDYRILQSCSDRGGSKPIDMELASRLLKAFTYFKSFRNWQELYKTHLDLEAHTNLGDIRSLVKEIYPIYSPFPRDPDDYDFCAMSEIFVGPNDGTHYSVLWSKQLANFCLSSVETQDSANNTAKSQLNKIRQFNEKLLDGLFDPENLDTSKELASLTNRSFEPLKTSLGVL